MTCKMYFKFFDFHYHYIFFTQGKKRYIKILLFWITRTLVGRVIQLSARKLFLLNICKDIRRTSPKYFFPETETRRIDIGHFKIPTLILDKIWHDNYRYVSIPQINIPSIRLHINQPKRVLLTRSSTLSSLTSLQLPTTELHTVTTFNNRRWELSVTTDRSNCSQKPFSHTFRGPIVTQHVFVCSILIGTWHRDRAFVASRLFAG